MKQKTHLKKQLCTHAAKLQSESRLCTKAGEYNSDITKMLTLEHAVDEMAHVYFMDKKPRILHLLASSKYSGAENVACTIITETRNQVDAAYCSPAGEIDEVLEKRRIKKISINRLSRKAVGQVIKEWQPDMIHAHDFRASIIASYFANKVKIISHIHQKPNWLNSINLRSVLYVWHCRKISKIITVTNSIKDSFIMTIIPGHKVVTVYSFVSSSAIIKLGAHKLDQKYDLIFCGRLEPVKQPLDFLRIVNKVRRYIPDVQAAIVGEGSLSESCKDYIRSHTLQHNVTLLGFQDNPYKFIANSSCLVITSKNEGFGLVAIEAAILGRKVFSYPLDTIRELFVNGVTFGEKDDLANAIKHTLSDNSTSGTPRVNSAIIDRDKWLSKLHNIYGELLEAIDD